MIGAPGEVCPWVVWMPKGDVVSLLVFLGGRKLGTERTCSLSLAPAQSWRPVSPLCPYPFLAAVLLLGVVPDLLP